MKFINCPYCKKYITLDPKRICSICGNPILKIHKFQYVTDNGKTFIQHRCCDNPGDYFSKEKLKKMHKKKV